MLFAGDTIVDTLSAASSQFTVNGTLTFPNGVTYTFANSLATYIRDRNGNQISLSYSNNALTQVTDSLGHVISINYQDPSCGCVTITYPGYEGVSRVIKIFSAPLASPNVLRSGFSIESYNQLFPADTTDQGNFNPTVLTAVQYPDGREFTFQYDSYAELARINLPAGGAVEYDYGDGSNGSTSGYQLQSGTNTSIIYRRLQERREYSNGSTLSSRTHYTVSYPNSTTVDTDLTYDGSGRTVAQVVHTMNGTPLDSFNVVGIACNAWNEGLETQTANGTPSALRTSANTYTPQSGCMNNPQLANTTTTLNDTNQMSRLSYLYDTFNNITDVKQYDWGNGSPGALLRETQTAYLWSTNSNYYDILNGLPASQTVLDGSGNQIAKTIWNYDQTSVQANPGMVGHDDADYPPSANYRGNLTSEQHWINTSNGYATTTRTFDIAGNVLTRKDPDNNSTTFSYADPQNTYAHATKATNALQQYASASYDYSTGKMVTATGLNGEQTSYAYNDPLDRITAIEMPNGGNKYYSYPNYTTVTVQQDQNTPGDSALKSQTIYDGFGRVSESELYETSSQYIAATQTYNALGAIASTTNPSRSGDGLNYSTSYSYDSLGRILQVAASDGVTSTVSYRGNANTGTDPASHTKTYTRNALGELQSVAETVQAGTVLYTYYSYDTLGDLVCMSHSACPSSPARSFTYDSLRRLLSTVNPESGTVTYSYDSAGNQLSRTDNRNITTTYSYDKLNRLTTVTYPSGSGSQNVTYTYDTGGANSIGKLVSISNGSATNYTAFDSMGHVLSSSQTTIGTTYPFTYTYNLAGALTSETYPSGRVVSTGYDGANRPLHVSGVLQGQTTNYLTSAWYWPQGEIGYYTFGNNIVPNAAYNRHFQPTKIYAAINNSSNSFLFLECYNWGAPNADSISGTCPTWSGTTDNGNLYGSVTYAGGPGAQSSLTAYTDTFTYDGLNRLGTANDSGGWSRTYNYDPYGNMWVTNPTGPGLNSATPTSDVYNSNNQLSTAHYDLSGNQLTLGPYTLNYDAENHQYSESNTIGNPAAGYSYDGAGKRVARLVGAQTTVYVYDAFGALAAAYSNGGMGTPPCHTCYLTYDHLGTTRLITDSNAKVIARHDYLPFGEEIPGGIAGRSSSQFGPGLDNINQKFTGQERDSESGLDFFQARYFSGALGRLLSPDPRNAGADLMNPQSWNAYPYGLNNPLRYVDPSGLAPDEIPYVYTPPTTVTAPLDSDDDFGRGGGSFLRPTLLGLDPVSGYQTTLAAQDAAKNILKLAFSPPQPQPTPSQPPVPTQPAPSQPAPATPTSHGPSIVSLTYTWQLSDLGADIGGLFGPEGVLPGALLGSMTGVGINVSYVPSTESVYVGPVFSAGLGVSAGEGWSVGVLNVPPTQDPNSIAGGATFSVNYQPTPLTGATVLESPGSGPPVVGMSFGTRIPVAGTAGYSWCVWNCGP